MRINRIVVARLFDRFNHDLRFENEERITIMIGPNGFGKTMVLKIINALFNYSLASLLRMPFGQVDVYFDDGSRLSVTRNAEDKKTQRRNLELFYKDASGHEETLITNSNINPKELPFPLSIIDDIIPVLDQIGPALWRNMQTGETLGLEEVLEQFEPQLPGMESNSSLTIPPWLQAIRESIPVRFINTERLTRPLPSRKREPRYGRNLPTEERTVILNSDDLAERVKKTLTEYGALAQSLDRTFPVRLVEEQPPQDLSMDVIRRELADVEAKRAKLVEAGLLKQEAAGWGVPALDKVDESKRGVLAVFARDAKQKLGVFDDLYARVDALKRIANSRLLYKRVIVSADGVGVVGSDGSPLKLEMLSSGEQHELVLLYDLLFRIPNNSFILIDEPELSLHVAWQEEFLEDLQEIAKLSAFRALLATHSPQVIGDRWDLVVELKGPVEG